MAFGGSVCLKQSIDVTFFCMLKARFLYGRGDIMSHFNRCWYIHKLSWNPDMVPNNHGDWWWNNYTGWVWRYLFGTVSGLNVVLGLSRTLEIFKGSKVSIKSYIFFHKLSIVELFTGKWCFVWALFMSPNSNSPSTWFKSFYMHRCIYTIIAVGSLFIHFASSSCTSSLRAEIPNDPVKGDPIGTLVRALWQHC